MVKISKYLSRHLRHAPEDLGLTLQPGGWVGVAELLEACARAGFTVSRDELDTVVAENEKQRFSFDEAGTRIRANQGHSTAVDLQLEPQTPPDVLYHGTATETLDVILTAGVQRMSRHHVHLSTTVPAALDVGRRHGTPVALRVDAAGMHRDGIVFYCSENGVWLVDAVPARYLQVV
jgi:putative RNA 2'-phosphotransferase